MIRLVSAFEMREMDRITIEEVGIPGGNLMETAGGSLARGVMGLKPDKNKTIAILCGMGNNGGDGFVIARHLKNAGFKPFVFIFQNPEAYQGDALANYKRILKIVPILQVTPDEFEDFKARIEAAGVIIDAVFGTGLKRPVEGFFAAIIEAANEVDALKIAVDIPTGLNSDTGQPLGRVFQADHTYTFGEAKIGQALHPGVGFCGALHIVDIGIPEAVAERVGESGMLLTESLIRALITPREANTHKGDYGHLLLFAGSPEKAGAALLSAHGALRAGAGLVTLATNEMTRLAVNMRHPEAMGEILPADISANDAGLLALKLGRKKSAIAIGPGFGLGEVQWAIIETLLEKRKDIPLLLDADALTLLAEHGFDTLMARSDIGGQTILTPHPGEAARLLRATTKEVQENRPEAAKALAEKTGAIVVLKGARTLVTTPEGYHYVCPFGNAGLATGGAGDLLTGIIGALAAQKPERALEAAIIGVVAHAVAGDIAAETMGQRGAMPSDVADGLGLVWAAWEADSDVASFER